MEIIPVIDLKAGLVVHARGGARHSYQPIETKLSPTALPGDVLAGLCRAVAVRSVYIADLDAIERQGSHSGTIADLAARFPDLAFWADAGLEAASVPAWLASNGGEAVVGSESQPSAGAVRALAAEKRWLLSLDFRGETFLGPEDLLRDTTTWPSRVIVRTLARVGGGAGPDLARVAEIVARAEGRAVYAAGGVRNEADLKALAKLGARGALVATAIHSGAITSQSDPSSRAGGG